MQPENPKLILEIPDIPELDNPELSLKMPSIDIPELAFSTPELPAFQLPLLEYLIKTYTNEGETVLDNCMGSGSTGIACLNTNRNFIGIELDENYFRVAENRINNWQG